MTDTAQWPDRLTEPLDSDDAHSMLGMAPWPQAEERICPCGATWTLRHEIWECPGVAEESRP